MKKALLLIDPQNDFFPGGALGVAGGDEIIPVLNSLLSKAEQENWLIVVTGDQHPEKTRHFDKWPVHCVAGTKGADFHKDLNIPKTTIIISKGMSDADDGYSPFEGVTAEGLTLDQVLKQHNIEKLIVAGLATDYCVKAGVIDACDLDYSVVVVEDGIKAVNIESLDGYAATLEMQAACAHFKNSKEVLNGKATV